jgi:predicted Zn-dependent protease with MMP-like domain
MSARDALDRGWRLLEEGDVAGARRAALRAARADRDDPDPLLLQAACEREEERLDEAEALLRRCMRMDPEWPTPVLWLAEMLADDPDRQAEALEEARRAAALAEDGGDLEDGEDLEDEEDEEDGAGDEVDVRREEWLTAMVLAARLELAAGDEAAARETVASLADVGAPDDPDLALDVADLLRELREWRAARARYEAVTREHPDLADAWYGAGCAAEAQDDDRAKVAAWLEARRLDEASPAHEELGRLTEEEFVEVAEAALEELPERARALLEDVPILVADVPSEEDVRSGLDPRILGLFTGLAYPDRSSLGGPPQITQIVLFRGNLERVAHDVDELREEIRITLIHETGHFFGLSEDELHEMGLG